MEENRFEYRCGYWAACRLWPGWPHREPARSHFEMRSPVGASLLAKAVYQATTMSTETTHSRASPLPPGSTSTINAVDIHHPHDCLPPASRQRHDSPIRDATRSTHHDSHHHPLR